ncbi:hypothetical protein NPIL_549781 [Nephila pilipes]|uniref:Uncharacterized protein n=1 Tax=Nephila pilipes TaxID=299642 RepID=A0A8X6MKG1_NEPPI|nr:hypothetical protein NPIL_549781 [Nephila pilipes]
MYVAKTQLHLNNAIRKDHNREAVTETEEYYYFTQSYPTIPLDKKFIPEKTFGRDISSQLIKVPHKINLYAFNCYPLCSLDPIHYPLCILMK